MNMSARFQLGCYHQIICRILREKMTALEEAANGLKMISEKGIMLVVDGTDPELVENHETDLACVESSIKLKLLSGRNGELGPAWGDLFTWWIDLMLKNMEDASTIDRRWQQRLLQHWFIYKLVMANHNPIAGKLKLNNDNGNDEGNFRGRYSVR